MAKGRNKQSREAKKPKATKKPDGTPKGTFIQGSTNSVAAKPRDK